MNKKQTFDLIFITISFIVALLPTVFVIGFSLVIPFYHGWNPIMFVLSLLFGIFDFIFFVNHSSVHVPIRYEKEHKYATYALFLAIWNTCLIIFPIISLFTHAQGLG